MTAATTDRGRRTRERLIAGAAELIREQGAEKTSLDEILAHTGTSKSQLYHYFAHKDDLVRAVIAHNTNAVLEQSSEVMNNVTSWSTLRHWFDAIVATQEADGCRHGCPVGSLAAELADHNEGARAELSASFASWQEEIGAILQGLKTGGRLRPRADVQQLATATLAAIQGGLLLSKTFRDPGPLRASLEANYAYIRSFAAVGG